MNRPVGFHATVMRLYTFPLFIYHIEQYQKATETRTKPPIAEVVWKNWDVRRYFLGDSPEYLPCPKPRKCTLPIDTSVNKLMGPYP